MAILILTTTCLFTIWWFKLFATGEAKKNSCVKKLIFPAVFSILTQHSLTAVASAEAKNRSRGSERRSATEAYFFVPSFSANLHTRKAPASSPLYGCINYFFPGFSLQHEGKKRGLFRSSVIQQRETWCADETDAWC